MNRAARRTQRPKRTRPGATVPDTAPRASGRSRRLTWLLALGIVLVCVAAYVRQRAESNPQLRIPPVETKDVLPTVAKEFRIRQENILADPASAEAWGMYGLVLLAHDFRDQAAACFAEAEDLAGNDYRWPYYYGMTMGTSDTAKSLEAFQRAVAQAPHQVAVRLRLAEWLFDLRQLSASQRQAFAALELDPDNPRAQLLVARLRFQEGDMVESLSWAQRAADSPQGNRRDVHELLARVHTRLGHSTEAAQEVERAEMLPRGVTVWDDPEMGVGGKMLRDASILNALATIHHARGDSAQWLELLRQVVDKEPDNIRAKENLAQALVETEQFEEAQRFIDKTLQEYPDFSQFECLRGQIAMAAGETDAARKHFERAKRLKPDYADAFVWWGRSLALLQHYPAAISALQEAVRLSPSMATAYDELGQVLLTAGRPIAAVKVAQHAAALKPGDLSMGLHLAEAMAAAGQRGEAIQILQTIEHADQAPREAQELLKKLKIRDDAPAASSK